MSERFTRTEMLLGKEAMSILAKSKVIVFGLGGVGGYTVEALARSGVGNLTLVDNDVVSESNINRQIIALEQTVGKYKTDVCAERVLSINPDINVTKKQMFFLPENAQNIDFTEFDYIVDAIDTVSAKICLAETGKQAWYTYNQLYGNRKQIKSRNARNRRHLLYVCMSAGKSYAHRA